MTPWKRFIRGWAMRLNADATDAYFVAIGRYGQKTRKVSAAVDVLIDAMNDVLLAVLTDRSDDRSDVDLRAVVSQNVSRASAAVADGLRTFRELEDPDELFLDARQARASVAAKAGIEKVIEAAANLLLVCENPFQDELGVWLSRYIEYSRALFDARTAMLEAPSKDLRKHYPSIHFARCLASVSRMDRLTFELFLGGPAGGADLREIRARLGKEAQRALEAIATGEATVPRVRERLAKANKFEAMTKPLRLLDEMEKSFAVERQIVAAFLAIAEEGASPEAILDRYLTLRAFTRERVRLIERRNQILTS
jgi:hypothetical protein